MTAPTKGIQCVLRFRPLNATEKASGPDPCVQFFSSTEVSVVDRDGTTKSGSDLRTALDLPKQFTFDGVFQPSASQEDLFNRVGRPVVDNVLKGYNGTILAYGQTGSGKTHSMLGPEGGTLDVLSTTSPHYPKRGVIPRLIEELFGRLEKMNQEEQQWLVTASVFELYKESIQDLLRDGPQQDYKIREDSVGGKGVYVENLYAKRCLSASEVLEAVRVGVTRRKVAATRSNETSSRSHSLTVIALEQINHVNGGTVTRSRLNLVDLAGSEKIAKTHADGDRLQEAKMINLSLTLLGNVIYKLTDGKSEYIPYRDSKLTRILQDSFGGNSITTLLCHCSPAMYNKEETVSTLRFASRAKQIKNAPRVNRELSQKELQLQLAQALDRIRQLEERLAVTAQVNNNSSPQRHRLLASTDGEGAAGSSKSHVDAENGLMAMSQTAKALGMDGGGGADNETSELRRLVDSLLMQLDEVKRDLYQREETLADRDAQVEFWKKRAHDAETELEATKQRAARDEARLQQQLADALSSQPQLLQQGGANVLLDYPGMMMVGSNGAIGDSSAASSKRHVVAVGSGANKGLRRMSDTRSTSSTRPLSQGDLKKENAPLAVKGTTSGLNNNNKLTDLSVEGKMSLPAPPPPPLPSNLGDTSASRNVQPGSGRGGAGGGRGRGAPNANQLQAVETLDSPMTLISTPEVLIDSSTAGTTSPVPPLSGTSTPPPLERVMVETSEIGIMAVVGKTATDYENMIQDMEHHLKQLLQKQTASQKQIADQQSQIAALSDLIDVTKNERDDVRQELDALRTMLDSKEKELDFLKRIMEELNINLSDFGHLLNSEKHRAAKLEQEAHGLRSDNDVLRETAEQQEYIEMATMELLVKSEDMDWVERDLMRMPELPTEELFLKKRTECLTTIQQLSDFLAGVSGTLRRRKFNTGNLESRRLQLVDEAATLQFRVDEAKTLLKG